MESLIGCYCDGTHDYVLAPSSSNESPIPLHGAKFLDTVYQAHGDVSYRRPVVARILLLFSIKSLFSFHYFSFSLDLFVYSRGVFSSLLLYVLNNSVGYISSH